MMIISELSIYTTDDSWTVEMPISFMCAALNLSSFGPSSSTTRKGPDNRRGEDATFDVLPSQKPSGRANRKLPNNEDG